jgi:hypothetical protein
MINSYTEFPQSIGTHQYGANTNDTITVTVPKLIQTVNTGVAPYREATFGNLIQTISTVANVYPHATTIKLWWDNELGRVKVLAVTHEYGSTPAAVTTCAMVELGTVQGDALFAADFDIVVTATGMSNVDSTKAGVGGTT